MKKIIFYRKNLDDSEMEEFFKWPQEISDLYECRLIGDEVSENFYNWYIIDLGSEESMEGKFNDWIDDNIALFLKQNNIKIMLWMPLEPIHPVKLYTSMLEFFKLNKIDLNNVYLVQNNLSLDKFLHPDVNIRTQYSSEWFRFRQLLYYKTLPQTKFTKEVLSDSYIEKNFTFKRNKKYFLPIRNVKIERILLLSILNSLNILDCGYYSILGIEDGKYNKNYQLEKVDGKLVLAHDLKELLIHKTKYLNSGVDFDETEDSFYSSVLDYFDVTQVDIGIILNKVRRTMDGNENIGVDFKDFAEGLYDKQENLEIDTKISKYDRFEMGIYINQDFDKEIKDSLFTITYESVFEDKHPIVMTEKVWKPIIYMHPFIVLGSVYTLKNLKKLGYKTFPEFFDESYDEIEDHRERLIFCAEQISKVCQKPIEELNEMYLSVKDKLIYNRNLYFSFNLKETFKNWFIY
jgi:hypothetical protein